MTKEDDDKESEEIVYWEQDAPCGIDWLMARPHTGVHRVGGALWADNS